MGFTDGYIRKVFQSTLPARGATQCWKSRRPPLLFQSTLPARGATIKATGRAAFSSSFQSTLPARGATLLLGSTAAQGGEFQSTLPARGATRPSALSDRPAHISIHAPRTGSDDMLKGWCIMSYTFQSTLPARGATIKLPNKGRRSAFQSTLPARGATANHQNIGGRQSISIHAPRTGSDGAKRHHSGGREHFNPRSPHGERPIKATGRAAFSSSFQSTLPARGATSCKSSFGC